MSNIIDKIQLSGVTYDIGGQGGSGVSVVEVTQAEYDALPSSAKTDTSKMYVITDAEAGDLTNYYTKTETDNLVTAATATKQDTLVSGTNIKTINNQSLLGSGNIDIQSGGGKAIEAGRGISITTGETADTVSFNLPISAGTGENSIVGNITQNTASGKNALALGGFYNSQSSYGLSVASGLGSVSFGGNASGEQSFAAASMASTSSGQRSATIAGYSNNSKGVESLTSGRYVNAENMWECSFGYANVSHKANNTWGDSGNTLFSVGNGTSNSARHNAFEIRQNGDIYLSLNGQDVKLQDQLGGGSSYTAGDGIDITNDVISVTGKADTSSVTEVNDVVTAHTADTTVHVTAQDKATWNAKSDFSGDYNDLTNKLSAGTNITIVDNVISATGGGGGSTYTAGRGIDITNDVISISLPISAGTGTNSIIENDANNVASGQYSHAEGQITSATTDYAHAEGKATIARGAYSHAEGWQNTASGQSSHAEGKNTKAGGDRSHAEGWQTISKGSNSHAEGSSSYASGQNSHAEGFGTSALTDSSHAEGHSTRTTNISEHASGQFNVSSSGSSTFGDSGNTLFSVGNGTATARHNAFEIRQNGDIYLNDGTKLQDTITATASNTTALGGLSLVKLSQAEYDALATKDSNTLYVIVN